MKNSATRPRRSTPGVAFCVSVVVGVYLLTTDLNEMEQKPISAGVIAPALVASPVPATAVRSDRVAPVGLPAITDTRTGLFEQNAPGGRRDQEVTGLEQMVERAQGHGTSFERWEAISALGESDEEIAEHALMGSLYDHNPSIREAAVEALGALATPGAIGGLGYALIDTNTAVRRTAIELLADIGTSAALEALAMALNDPDTDLRLAAIYEIADHDSIEATVLLQQFLFDDDSLVREVAAESVRN